MSKESKVSESLPACPGDYTWAVATWLLLGAMSFLEKLEQVKDPKGKGRERDKGKEKEI